MAEDRLHFVLCDWNLYPDQRGETDLCNLQCLKLPRTVAENWSQADLGYPELRRREAEWQAARIDGPVACIVDEDGGVCGLDSCPRCGAHIDGSEGA